MPIPTPFHSRTATMCESHEWRTWSGYLAASVYEHSHEREYYAIRNAAGLIDVSPLYKYDVVGPDALRLVNKIMTRNAARLVVEQIMYSPWCDEDGQMIDDGTIWRLGPDHFRITAADPSLRWFQDCGAGMDVAVTDVSRELAALALQGPLSRQILKQVAGGVDLDHLKYFRLAQGIIDGFPVTITRTGYTGDLGYELWVAPDQACRLWDVLLEAGRPYGLLPAGMVALDMARIEAGLLLIEVDYISSLKALIEARKSSPLEAGLGWTVALDKGPFVGRRALVAEKAAGPAWTFVGLEIDWPSLERLFAAFDLPPLVAGRASRVAVPVYNDNGRQIGQVTSSTFSPILKKYIALATLESAYGGQGTRVNVEITVEYTRQQAPAVVVKTPFFDPPRKRA
ncbi:MAG: aminomethyltransferase family protein [Chloroflexi bacterium]|nr:aminomethyltransferase family protein [Chloroflexota bacterium]MCI0580631.1 aminomethyltransferase family protein [Chloroflexota bacterium]MCI0647643.1 aminomethyltransferase family protein [Chloroflexota bacterium]MCI0731141.1 aminomethyltransferase family protein [Chloroflexota bacterium]